MLIWALGTLTHRLEGANAKSIASPLLAAPRSARNGTAAACITLSLSEDRLVRSLGPITGRSITLQRERTTSSRRPCNATKKITASSSGDSLGQIDPLHAVVAPTLLAARSFAFAPCEAEIQCI